MSQNEAAAPPQNEKAQTQTHQRLLGLLFGIAFGFLLQKGGVGQYEVLMGALLLRDITVFKIILSAILVGMVGVFVHVCLQRDCSLRSSRMRGHFHVVAKASPI